MKLSAQANFLRMAPRKVQLVARLIAGVSVTEAEAQLEHSMKLSAEPIAKLLHSAVANALDQLTIKKDDLYIKEITVNHGPTLHRYQPRAFGRAGKIRKRTSHVTIELGIKDSANVDLAKAKKKTTAPAKPTKLSDLEKAIAKEAATEAKKAESTNMKHEEKSASGEAAKVPSQGHKHADFRSGSKGSDGKFMKKIFSRKVG